MTHQTTRRDFLKVIGIGGLAGAAFASAENTAQATSGISSADWPMHRYDAANTGYNPNANGPKRNVGVKWDFSTLGEIVSSPAVVDGTVYIGSKDGHLYALDATDGSEVWKFHTGDDVESSPVVANGTVYVANQSGDVYSLNTADGSQQWKYDGSSSISSPLAVYDNVVFVHTEDDYIRALNTTDGSQKYYISDIISPPTITGDYLMAGEWYGGIEVHDMSEGDYIDHNHYLDGVNYAPTYVNGTIYAGDYGGDLASIDQSDMTKRWSYSTSDYYSYSITSPVIVNRELFTSDTDGTVYLFDSVTGDLKWTKELDTASSASLVVADQAIYASDDSGKIYALDATDGSKLWTYQTGSGIASPPAIVDGTLYVGSKDGYVYALEGELEAPAKIGTNENPPTDPDGDGLYEDINGNGRMDYDDVADFFDNRESSAVTDDADLYDFDGNGRVDTDDVRTLFDEI